MLAAVVLIELASSDLWRNRLHRSNFTSCEEIMSTEEGKRSALGRMFKVAAPPRRDFLCKPVKIVTTVRRLEELQCPNVAEVVIMWAWTAGVVNPVDRGAWRLIGDVTLMFYQNNGMGRLVASKRHITNTIADVSTSGFSARTTMALRVDWGVFDDRF